LKHGLHDISDWLVKSSYLKFKSIVSLQQDCSAVAIMLKAVDHAFSDNIFTIAKGAANLGCYFLSLFYFR